MHVPSIVALWRGSGPNERARWSSLEGLPLHALLTIAGLSLLGLYVGVQALRALPLQWDLRSYVMAGRAALAGVDPYVQANLTEIAGRQVHPFIYPPITLLPFSALSLAPAPPLVWIASKLTILGAMIWMWSRMFVPHAGVLAIAMVAVFGWNMSALWDIRTGNVALIECGLLWAAFGFYVRGRRSAFAALVAVASLFKIFPALFLLLLLVPARQNLRAPATAANPRLLAITLVALVAALAVPLVVGPAAGWGPFFANIPVGHTLGHTNPSMLGFLITLAQTAAVPEPWATRAGYAAWMLFGAAVVAFGWPLLRHTLETADPKQWVMVAVLLYLLLAPRPMAYGYILLTPVPLFFAPRPFDSVVGRWMLVLVLAAQGLSTAARHHSDALAFIYAPCLITACLWVLVAQSARERSGSAGQATTTPAHARVIASS